MKVTSSDRQCTCARRGASRPAHGLSDLAVDGPTILFLFGIPTVRCIGGPHFCIFCKCHSLLAHGSALERGGIRMATTVAGTRGALAPGAAARTEQRFPAGRAIGVLRRLQPPLKRGRRWSAAVPAAGRGRSAGGRDPQSLGRGGLDPALERAVPAEQRPVNELKALRQTSLYSWVGSQRRASSATGLMHDAQLSSKVAVLPDTTVCSLQATLSTPSYLKRLGITWLGFFTLIGTPIAYQTFDPAAQVRAKLITCN